MYLFERKFCPNICPGVGLMGHMVVAFFFFFGLFRTGVESEL